MVKRSQTFQNVQKSGGHWTKVGQRVKIGKNDEKFLNRSTDEIYITIGEKLTMVVKSCQNLGKW